MEYSIEERTSITWKFLFMNLENVEKTIQISMSSSQVEFSNTFRRIRKTTVSESVKTASNIMSKFCFKI